MARWYRARGVPSARPDSSLFRTKGRPFVTNSHLEVSDASNDAAVKFPNTTVADLVRGLTQAHVGTRNIIAILQAIKAAGALHAEIIVQ